LRIHPEIDPLVDDYYTQIMGTYWAPDRKHIDQSYERIAFPFSEIRETGKWSKKLAVRFPIFTKVGKRIVSKEKYPNPYS